MSAIRPPRQARSEASMQRIVAAAKRLLEEEGFEGVSVGRIAREAGSSVGVFYSRFRDKGGLLEYLAERYLEEASAEVARFAASREGRRTRVLAAEVRAAVGLVVGFHRERAGWIRALSSEIWTRPGGAVAAKLATMSALPPGLVRGISAALDRRDGEALERVGEGYSLVLSVVRERVLFSEAGRAATTALGQDELIDLLTRMWLGLLPGRAAASGNL